jgi:sulfate transport system permease protein
MKKKFLYFFIIFYTFIILFLPILGLFNKISDIPFELFIKRSTEPIVLSAYFTTISLAFFATVINTFFGFIVAWILTRYTFPGKKFLDSCIDLPFALPTSVAGLTLVTVYSQESFIGYWLKINNIEIVFNKLGVILAMSFVSFPFVVRSIQPVLQEIDREIEEVSWSLGASSWKTFQTIIFPTLLPSIFTGASLSFSRAIGEYGSVVIISSNFPFKDLITSVLIFQSLEQYDYVGATIIGAGALILSLILLLSINFFQSLNQQILKN